MLAALGDAPLVNEGLAYEPKYDGIRALIELTPGRTTRPVRIWSRLGNEKTFQFPDVIEALSPFARGLRAPVLLDGEIVALDETGHPAGFQRLQGRIHVTNPRDLTAARRQPVTFVAFDVLRDGGEDLRRLPLTARRARLERIYGNTGRETFRLSQFAAGDGRALERAAFARGGEGLIAKRLDSRYVSGRRSSDWTKLKLVARQDAVVAGWTEPRQSRAFFGALLLGVYDGDALEYVGHTGTGFTHAELARLAGIMKPLETGTCPFRLRPNTNERPHWIRPELVIEVKFAEWTRDGKLRAPVYVGQRDDVRLEDVRREPLPERHVARRAAVTPRLATPPRPQREPPASGPLAPLVGELEDLEARRAAGRVTLPDGKHVEVTHLDKILWPRLGITKGELMRYYVRIAAALLPALADRPLVMKRFPNGVDAKAFYQQRAPARVPDGVRVEVLPSDTEVPSRLIGGSLITLLHMTQLAVISQDPWFSRVGTPDSADHVAFDLDPMPGVGFARVLDVARWIRDELGRLGVPGVPKTSGADGLHIYVPLPPRTSYEAGRLFCQIIATLVADRHPDVATVERAVATRGQKVYVDYLQNIRGKTLATAYSARASDFAGVSTPLTWDEVDRGVDRREFTMRTVPGRLVSMGDLWTRLRTAGGADLRAVLQDAEGFARASARTITSSKPRRGTRGRAGRGASGSAAARTPTSRTRR
jgi:bifunctional non-homologous end joining protein LigD